jgi:hypothetical protein
MDKVREFTVTPTGEQNIFMHGDRRLQPPEAWVFVPSGDPGLTRRIKVAGDYWVVVVRRKNRLESRGVWADRTAVEQCRNALACERENPAYKRKLAAARRLRAERQRNYEYEFRQAVLAFLDFAPECAELAGLLADRVTRQTVPVGSGTVARTERIPLARRAEAAVIAWLRHQTTAYDHTAIARVKGARREVRRTLAERSRQLLESYRRGNPPPEDRCPLREALSRPVA